MTSYTTHPLADVFPEMTESEYTALVEDVRLNGLLDPIVLVGDQILDGRHRYRACIEASVEPRFTTYDGPDALAYVISHNLKRRHLTESQRAMVAARISNLPRGRPEKVDASTFVPTTVNEAAEAMQIGRDSVISARRVQREGIPALQEAVEQGAVSVKAAVQVAKLPAEEQEEVLGEGPRAVVAKANEIRTAPEPEAAPKSPSRTHAAAAERRRVIAEMNEQGYRNTQIAERLGLNVGTVGSIVSELGLTSVEMRIGKGRRIDVNRVMQGVVDTAEVPQVTLDLLEGQYDALDRAQLDHWIEALSKSISALNEIRRRLRASKEGNGDE